MTYGSLISQVMGESGVAAIYPSELDAVPIGFPVIQYRETDWELVKRLASRFEMSLYPEPTMGGAKLYVGLPETGTASYFEESSYVAHRDEKFYTMGGDAAGRSRIQYLTYEVRSQEAYRVGEQTVFQGRSLYIGAKRCCVKGGQLEFTYVLSTREWTGARQFNNEKISGMSLLGTVLGCEGQTVKLKLDIDKDHPDQNEKNAYPWLWAPTTGNVMYLMSQTGTPGIPLL